MTQDSSPLPIPLSALSNVAEQPEAERLDLASRLGGYLDQAHSAADRRAAMEIARVLSADASNAVRSALVNEIKNCDFLPVDVTDRILADLEEISVPFVRGSRALEDERLIRLVRVGSDDLHLAVADRDSVSEPVCYALCEVAKEPAVSKLMENGGASLSERAYFMVVDRFPECESLMTVMSQRGDLPVDVAEAVLERASETCAEFLVERFRLAPDFASYIAESARRRVMGQTLESAPSSALDRYMVQLARQGDLNSDLLLHLVRNGNIRSFLAGVAVLTEQTSAELDTVIKDRGTQALSLCLERIGCGRATISMMLTAFKASVPLNSEE